MSLTDLTTNKVYSLKKGERNVIGRHKFGITSKYVSSEQFDIYFDKKEQLWFIKKIAEKVVLLSGNALLHKLEYELAKEDIIEFGLEGHKTGKRAKYVFTSTESKDVVNRTVAKFDKIDKEKQRAEETNERFAEDITSDEDENTKRLSDNYDDTRFDSQDDKYSINELSDESDYVA